jgi:hypothetical protein
MGRRRIQDFAFSTIIIVLALMLPTAGFSAEQKLVMADITFDNSQKPVSLVLKNVEGKVVSRGKYQGNILALTDLSGKMLLVFEFDSKMRVRDSQGLCLDDRGNVLRDQNSKPITMDIKAANGKGQNTYGMDEKGIPYIQNKIYPCQNCREITGKNCIFVFGGFAVEPLPQVRGF